MKINTLLLSTLVSVSFAAFLSSVSAVHEKLDGTRSKNWIKGAAIGMTSKISVHMALSQQNLDKGMEYLMKVSDPSSASYGKHYSQDEIVELFAPSRDNVAAIKGWLIHSGIPASSISMTKSQGWIHFETTAGQLGALLNTTYHTYSHVHTRRDHIGADEYSLPSHISELVDFVFPAVAFDQLKSGVSNRSGNAKAVAVNKQKRVPKKVGNKLMTHLNATSNCNRFLTPECILKMYGISEGDKHTKGNEMGVYGMVWLEYAQEDLDAFFHTYYPRIRNGTSPIPNFVDGAKAPETQNMSFGEANLDLQIPWPILWPQGIILYESQVEVNGTNGLFNFFLDAIDGSYCDKSAYGETGDNPEIDGNIPNEQCGAYKPANVISISYGGVEADYPASYQKRQCDEFMKLGLQGTSIFIASGDDGVSRREGQCLGSNHDIFNPGYPYGCPYLTAVGATALPYGGNPGDDEVAAYSFSSGGGFSNVYMAPDYQKAAVSAYLSQHDPGYQFYNTSDGKVPSTGGIYNRAGRGYPDLSAIGQNGVYVTRGKTDLVDGTSMAAPIVAAIFTRINEERLAAGKSTVGFVNPAIYKHPEVFHDVVQGDQHQGGINNTGCGNKGFSAVEGWDPVTGLGTPDYKKLLDLFLKL